MTLMRRPLICFGVLLCVVLGVVGSGPQAAAQAAKGSGAAGEQQSAQTPARDASAPPNARQPLTLSDQVIRDILEPLRTGMETQNMQMVLGVFDKKELEGYSDLQGQLRAFFHQYDEVNFRYQIMQVRAEAGRGSATADIQMDALPYEATQVPARRSAQMRFQLKLDANGWKISGFSPADFFNLGFQQPAR